MPDASSTPRGGHDALPPGTLLGDAYRVERVLGQGGFGVVYLATDTTLQRPVAIKEYLPVQLAGRGEASGIGLREPAHRDAFLRGLQSFLREARLLAQFDHPSLVRVYRFWEENHTAYMAMPYYEGQTLKAARARMQRPPEEAWLRDGLLLPLLGALQTLHGVSCLHRDVSPGNILLCDDGRAVLLDFGSARRVVGDMTQPLTAIVNPQYAAIEQYAESPSLAQGPWTDLYALAAVAYHALTGRPPVPATVRAVNEAAMPTMGEVAASIAGTFPSLRYGAPLLATLDRALSVRPADRPQSAAEMREALIRPHVHPDVTIEGPPLRAVPSADEEITLFDTAPPAADGAAASAPGADGEGAPADPLAALGPDGEPVQLDADEEQAMRALVSAALGEFDQWPPKAGTVPPQREAVVLPQVPPRDREQAEFAAARAALAGFSERRGPPVPGKVTLRVVPGSGGVLRREPVLNVPPPLDAAALAPAGEPALEPIESLAPGAPSANDWLPEADDTLRPEAPARAGDALQADETLHAEPAAAAPVPEAPPPLATRFDPDWEVTRPSVASVPIHPVQPLPISSLHVELPPTAKAPASAAAVPAAMAASTVAATAAAAATPAVPAVPAEPAEPAEPAVPAVPDLPELPVATPDRSLAETVEAAETAAVAQTPEPPEAPEALEAPETLEALEASGVLEAAVPPVPAAVDADALQAGAGKPLAEAEAVPESDLMVPPAALTEPSSELPAPAPTAWAMPEPSAMPVAEPEPASLLAPQPMAMAEPVVPEPTATAKPVVAAPEPAATAVPVPGSSPAPAPARDLAPQPEPLHARAERQRPRDPEFIDDAWADTVISADPQAEPAAQAANDAPPRRRGGAGAWRWVAGVAALGLLGWAGWQAAGPLQREFGNTTATAPAPAVVTAPVATAPRAEPQAQPQPQPQPQPQVQAQAAAPKPAPAATPAPAPTPSTPTVVAAAPATTTAGTAADTASTTPVTATSASPSAAPGAQPAPTTTTTAADTGTTAIAPDSRGTAAAAVVPPARVAQASPPPRRNTTARGSSTNGGSSANSSGTTATRSGGVGRSGTQAAARKPDTRAPVRVAQAPAGPSDPRAACGTRSNFALLYCMRQQCRTAKFTAHPQCQRMRLNDEL